MRSDTCRLLLLLTALVVGLALFVAGFFIAAEMRSAEVSPTTFTVNNAADPGDGTCDATECTLREAILAANANGGTDTIEFNIPGAGPHTIRPGTSLWAITEPVIIDGYTQSGARPNTNPPGSGGNAVLKIELDGTNAGPGAEGLHIDAGGTTVKGLAINRFGGGFGGAAIVLFTNGGNTVQGNYIGTDVNGTAALGNDSGVLILGAPDNTIGGTAPEARNLISGNGLDTESGGVKMGGAGGTGNLVQGNYIGTDVSGTAPLGNTSGVVMAGGGNTVGGTAPGARNVISGNQGDGVLIEGGGNLVQGNFIGTDNKGIAPLPNHFGVSVISAENNTIGGTTTGARNVISGNEGDGVYVRFGLGVGTLVQGNFIGTDFTGTAALGNGVGVEMHNAVGNTIGGTTTGARNVISGNGLNGVAISGIGSHRNLVQGNLIGTQVDGISALGNGSHGVSISGAGSQNTVGGVGGGMGNTIAFNLGDGVHVDSTICSTISANAIHSNAGKGIENINGGNMELAPPIVDSVVGDVSGHTNPKCYPCTIEVFSDSDDEGRIYHGSTTTNDDATGTWTYSGVVTGPNITATITHADGNTSEFSAPMEYSPPAVGGIAELPDIAASGDSPLRNYVALAALAATALLALTAGAWYARRRWLG